MLELICSTCGKRVQGDDSVAGQRVRCPGCNVEMTAPTAALRNAAIVATEHVPPTHAGSSDTAISEGLPPQEPRLPSLRKAAPHFVARMVPYVVVLAIVCITAALLVPSVERVREAAARTQSTNNLKQIGLAAQSFHDANNRLPFNGTIAAAADDPKSGTWAFQMLPYVERQAIFQKPNIDVGILTYMCPGRGRISVSTTGAWTDYFINSWLNDPQNGAPNAPDRKLTLRDITDGTSETIFAGHGNVDPLLYSANAAIAQSTDIFKEGDSALARRLTTNQRDMQGDTTLTWGGPFPHGALMCFCDGSVRLFSYTMTGGVIRNGVSAAPDHVRNFGAYLTPAGAEAVVQFD